MMAFMSLIAISGVRSKFNRSMPEGSLGASIVSVTRSLHSFNNLPLGYCSQKVERAYISDKYDFSFYDCSPRIS